MAAPTKRNLRAKKDDSVVIINPPIKKPAAGDTNGSLDEGVSLKTENLTAAIRMASSDPEKFVEAFERLSHNL